jgi:hypothetical protein
MSAWGNTDNSASKPKFDEERQTRISVQLTTANVTNAGNTTITFTYSDGAASNVANVGVAVGQFVYAANLSSNGVAGFFASNNKVTAISGNNVTFTNATFGSIPAGTVVEFDKVVPYATSNNYVLANTNLDTILVTPSRLANNTVNVGNITTGWNRILKTTNGGDGAVRYRHETLVVLANPVASNTNSGNTSFGQVYTGV